MFFKIGFLLISGVFVWSQAPGISPLDASRSGDVVSRFLDEIGLLGDHVVVKIHLEVGIRHSFDIFPTQIRHRFDIVGVRGLPERRIFSWARWEGGRLRIPVSVATRPGPTRPDPARPDRGFRPPPFPH